MTCLSASIAPLTTCGELSAAATARASRMLLHAAHGPTCEAHNRMTMHALRALRSSHQVQAGRSKPPRTFTGARNGCKPLHTPELRALRCMKFPMKDMRRAGRHIKARMTLRYNSPEPSPLGFVATAWDTTCTVISRTSAFSACRSTATNGRSASSCIAQDMRQLAELSPGARPYFTLLYRAASQQARFRILDGSVNGIMVSSESFTLQVRGGTGAGRHLIGDPMLTKKNLKLEIEGKSEAGGACLVREAGKL